jgi:hypothetical protein
MIDSIMAICMLMVGVCALLAILPVGWLNAGNTDHRSRAGDIMRAQLENSQELLMNPCNTVATPITVNKTIYSSGGTTANAAAGDFPFQVATTVRLTNVNPLVWNINCTVTWSGSGSGLSASRIVMQQEAFKYPTIAPDYSQCAAVTDRTAQL